MSEILRRALLRTQDEGVYRPQIFDCSITEQLEAMEALLKRHPETRCFDTIISQLNDLLTCRDPSALLQKQPEILKERVARHLGEVPIAYYGRWIYYPWSQSIVHVLPKAEFVELRSNRNQYKITSDEQRDLREKTIGVVGLSVGRSSVVTMGLEGIGGHYKLADFDHLELSNLNRLRSGVGHLGVNKAVLAARELYEIDPYLSITVFDEGITKDNIDSFLGDGDNKLDLLVEECDELSVKVLLREHARDRRIPVLMETSDRGLIDVERFDAEPDRPVFHGLIKGTSAEMLEGLSDQEKVPFALRILGANSMSQRLAASLVEIEETITGWPQLASAVALGGGILTDASRRLLLGQALPSGRYYVDLDELVSADNQFDLDISEPRSSLGAVPVQLPPLEQREPLTQPTAADIREIVQFGIRAPSGGNNQAWRFRYDGEKLRCSLDPERVQEFLEFSRTGSTVAMGCAVENMVLAAGARGLASELRFQPAGADSDVICDLFFSGGGQLDELAAYMSQRCTNRNRGAGRPLERGHADKLELVIADRPASLQLITDREEITRLADLMGRGDRIVMQHERVHRELMGDLRWTAEEVATRRDGIDVRTLDVKEFEKAAMRVISRWPVMEFLRDLEMGRALETASRRAVGCAAAMGLIVVPRTDARAHFDGGRALERLWLEVTRLGLGMQPITVLPALFARLNRGEGRGLLSWHREQLSILRDEFDLIFPRPAGSADIMLFRLAYAPAPERGSLRRRLDDVLSFEGTNA